MERSKIRSALITLSLLLLVCLPTVINGLVPEKAEPISFSHVTPASKLKVKVSQPTTLEGSYRLRLPVIPFKIKNKSLVIQLCNTHRFKITEIGGENKLKIQLVSSTEKACAHSTDQLFINLIESTTSYQINGASLQFLKGSEILFFARRSLDLSPIEVSFEGKWNLELRNLALEVSSREFSFEGCNTNTLSYEATADGKIVFGDPVSTEKGCQVDTDAIFLAALQNSVSFKTGEVSFELYGAGGKRTAYATPYLY